MERLPHVLSVGAPVGASVGAPVDAPAGVPMSTPMVVEMTDAEFEFEVERLVNEVSIAKGMSSEDRKKMAGDALDLAKRGGNGAYRGVSKTSKYAMGKSKGAARDIVDHVQRTWAGAKKPSHWAVQKTYKEAAKRLIKSYKMHIEKKGWENIKSAEKGTRVVYAETGMNLHAKIEITKEYVKIQIANSMQGFEENVVNGTVTFGEMVQTMDFADFTKALDNLITKTTTEFYKEYN